MKDNNALIGRQLGFTEPAIWYRKKYDPYFKNRPFIQAYNELWERYKKSINKLHNIFYDIKESNLKYCDFALLLASKGYFKSYDSARTFLSRGLFKNISENMPNIKTVEKYENIIKEYEIFRGIKCRLSMH